MTLESLALPLFGAKWKRAAARFLGVDARRVRRWASGQLPTPEWVIERLAFERARRKSMTSINPEDVFKLVPVTAPIDGPDIEARYEERFNEGERLEPAACAELLAALKGLAKDRRVAFLPGAGWMRYPQGAAHAE